MDTKCEACGDTDLDTLMCENCGRDVCDACQDVNAGLCLSCADAGMDGLDLAEGTFEDNE